MDYYLHISAYVIGNVVERRQIGTCDPNREQIYDSYQARRAVCGGSPMGAAPTKKKAATRVSTKVKTFVDTH
ncbi:MAG: hypothetical protein JO166_07705 [Deltaproteobacteria bacterium]|nr:hypothetical protein [Deltaproteobacteria bacterium]